jgi:tRNA A37 methylthiotransferase MiaB
MADPSEGVAAANEFFSLAVVHKWLKEYGPQPAWKPLAALPDPEVPPEVRAERVRMLKATAEVIRETVNAKCVGRPSGTVKPKQQHSPSKLMEAMDNLKALQHVSAAPEH